MTPTTCSHEAQPLLTVTEAAELLSVSSSFVYKLMRQGKLRPVRMGAATRFQISEIMRFIDDAR